jgi:hypothetical protein
MGLTMNTHVKLSTEACMTTVFTIFAVAAVAVVALVGGLVTYFAKGD